MVRFISNHIDQDQTAPSAQPNDGELLDAYSRTVVHVAKSTSDAVVQIKVRKKGQRRRVRGNQANETTQANWRYKLQAVADGLILREFFSVVPA